MRAMSVAFSPARPSRLKNDPGILPAAYIRSSMSTVRGMKSMSRRFPAVAVPRTRVSPEATRTGPEGCLARRTGAKGAPRRPGRAAGARAGRAGPAGGDEAGAGGLLGQSTRLEVDLRAADLDGNPVHFRHMF